MRNPTNLALCIAALCLAWPAAAQQPPVHDLRCENAPNPRGVKTQHPQLSWVFDPKPQSRAYQVLVATTEEKLNADDADLWDSGRVQSDQKTAQYMGKPPSSFQRCFWKVRVWNDYDTAGRYSDIASWQMGLLSFGKPEGR